MSCGVTVLAGLRLGCLGVPGGPVKQVTNDGGKVTAELVAGDTTNSGDVPGESAGVIAVAFLCIPPNRLLRPDFRQIVDIVVGC